MQRKEVESSNVKSVGYDPVAETLEVEFRNGGIYVYYNVPHAVNLSLMAAESIGAYIAKNIRGKYQTERLN